MDMFKHPLLRRWVLNLAFSWFATSLGYYVISTATTSVMGNLDFYLAFTLIALIEIPFIMVLTFAMKYIGRRALLASTLIICGILCLLVLVIPGENVIFICALLAKGFVSATFSLVFIYTAEVFPTVLRSFGVGICSLCARVATVASPYVTEAVRTKDLECIVKIFILYNQYLTGFSRRQRATDNRWSHHFGGWTSRNRPSRDSWTRVTRDYRRCCQI